MVKSMVSSITVCGRVIGAFSGPWHTVKEQDVYWHGKQGVP